MLAVVLSLAGRAYAYDSDGIADQILMPPAGSQEMTLAERHFKDGCDLFQSGRYDLARIEFEASYSLSHAPDLLHNLSVTLEKLGSIGESLSFEEQFLRAKRASLTEVEIDQSEIRLQRLRALVPQTANKPKAFKPPIGASVLLGFGIASLAVGIGCGVAALSTSQSLANDGPFYPSDYESRVTRGKALNISAISFDVIGGIAAASGTVWMIASRFRSR